MQKEFLLFGLALVVLFGYKDCQDRAMIDDARATRQAQQDRKIRSANEERIRLLDEYTAQEAERCQRNRCGDAGDGANLARQKKGVTKK